VICPCSSWARPDLPTIFAACSSKSYTCCGTCGVSGVSRVSGLGKGRAGARGFMGERKDHDSIQMGGTKWWWGLFSDSLDSSTRFLVYNYENTPSF
jgi:hypothetical protein